MVFGATAVGGIPMGLQRRPALRTPARLRRGAAVAGVAVATLAFGFWLGDRSEPMEPPDPAPELPAPPPAERAPPRPRRPRAVAMPIDRVTRLQPVEGGTVCALGGSRIACTDDGGAHWSDPVELPSPVLAVARLGPRSLAATVDGAVWELREGAEPTRIAEAPEELAVIDAAGASGALWLLGHRYDEPEDELTLPRVVETAIFTLGDAGRLEPRGTISGYGGERILVEPDGAVVTWAPFDRRAWRSADGGASFRRLAPGERFGAHVEGLRVAVERGAQRLPGPGRPARPISTVVVSADGETWETVYEAAGEVLVDFADARTGLIVDRGAGLAIFTRDGGATFAELWRDTRLDRAVALLPVDGGFLAATVDGIALLLPLPQE